MSSPERLRTGTVTKVVAPTDATPPRGDDGTGPVRAWSEVVAVATEGPYHSLTVVAPAVAARAEPGQFVSLGVGDGAGVLRRPFSIASTSADGMRAGTVEVVFDVVGAGTRWLAERRPHDLVDLVGPLGRGFPLPARPVGALVVGGGYGSAPLLYLARRLQARGLRVDAVLGAASEQRLLRGIETKRTLASATFTTEDGSLGTRGRVTDVLDDVLERTGAGVVYGCGPMPMLRAVAAVAERRGVPCQVAVEEAMACGVGVCMTCVLPVRVGDGVANARACTEGPVFDGRKVLWDRIGTLAMSGVEEPAP